MNYNQFLVPFNFRNFQYLVRFIPSYFYIKVTSTGSNSSLPQVLISAKAWAFITILVATRSCFSISLKAWVKAALVNPEVQIVTLFGPEVAASSINLNIFSSCFISFAWNMNFFNFLSITFHIKILFPTDYPILLNYNF